MTEYWFTCILCERKFETDMIKRRICPSCVTKRIKGVPNK